MRNFSKFLKTINGISGIATSTLILFITFDDNISSDKPTAILICICIFYVIFYNAIALIKDNDIIKMLYGIMLFLIGLSLIYVLAITFTNSQSMSHIVIGINIYVSIFIFVFKAILKPYYPNGLKLVILITIYLIFIFGIAYMYIPIGTVLEVLQNDNKTMIFLMFNSLKNSYVFPEYTDVLYVDFAHIIQFFTSRIFDTLMLGVSINILHGMITDNKSQNIINKTMD